MRIGIIGTGNIGGTLARLWSKAGHDIFISSRNPEKLGPLAAELNVQKGSPVEAALFGEVVLLSIPLSSVAELDLSMVEALASKTVIDTSNAYAERDGLVYDLSQAHVSGSSGWVAEKLSRSSVVRAFNTLYYVTLLNSAWKGLAIPIASEDDEALRSASKLVIDAGYQPFTVGTLAEGRYFEPGTPAYGQAVSGPDLAKLIQDAVGSPHKRHYN